MSDSNIVAGGDSISIGGLVTQIASSTVRHGLTSVGGYLAAHGVIASNQQDAFVGAGMILVGIGWSWWQKVGQQKALDELSRLKSIFSGGGVQAKAGSSNRP